MSLPSATLFSAKYVPMINKSLIGFWNTQALTTSFYEINEHPIIYDLLFLSETWLKPNQNTPYLPNYTEIIRINNTSTNINSRRNNGGLLLLKNKNLKTNPIIMSYDLNHIHIKYLDVDIIFV